MKYTSGNIRMWSRLGPSGAISSAVMELGKENEKVVLLPADMGYVSGLEGFKKRYPDRYFNIGIAEQNLIGVASGLANEGFVPFIFTYASFLSARALDQIKVSLGYMNLNVKMIGLFSGLSSGVLGPTHISLEDIAIMRTIPNIAIVCPADGAELVKAVLAAAQWDGPVYIRVGGLPNMPSVYSEDFEYNIGRSTVISDGDDVQILANGTMVHNALLAAETLREQGISCGVTDFHTIAPLDYEEIVRASGKKMVVTVEEHGLAGGFGSAVCEYLSDERITVPLLRIGLDKSYPKASGYQTLIEEGGLSDKGIAGAIAKKYKEIL